MLRMLYCDEQADKYLENGKCFDIETQKVGEPTADAPKEFLHSWFSFRAEQKLGKDWEPTQLVNKMIELFQNSKNYNKRTEKEKAEIIEYFKAHPYVK